MKNILKRLLGLDREIESLKAQIAILNRKIDKRMRTLDADE